MNLEQIRQIVEWIKEHPDHCDDGADESLFEYDTPAETWFRFCQEPTIICEYDAPVDYEMMGDTVENGCTFIFSRGPLKGMRCNRATVLGKDRCAFHDHPIFSDEVSNYIQEQHDNINKVCAAGKPKPPSSFQFVLDDQFSQFNLREEPTRIPVVVFSEGIFPPFNLREEPTRIPVVVFSEGLFRELTHNVILRHGRARRTIECIGYIIPQSSPGKRQFVLPLTPELRKWCEEQSITCV